MSIIDVTVMAGMFLLLALFRTPTAKLDVGAASRRKRLDRLMKWGAAIVLTVLVVVVAALYVLNALTQPD